MTERRLETARENLRPFYICLYVNAAIWAVEWSLCWLAPMLQRFGIRPFSPMAPWVERFSDFTHFLLRVAQFGRPGMLTRPDLEFPFPYPLPAVYIFLPFLKLTHRPVFWYLVCAVFAYLLVTCFLAWRVGKARLSGAAQILFWGTFVLMHPIWFLINRGNIEVFLWAIVTAGLVCFLVRQHMVAAVLFGLVASMKIYPGLLLLLFLKRRDYRALLLGFATMVAVTALTYHMAGPSIPQAMRDMQRSATFLNDTQVAVVQEKILRWDHSMFGLLKQTDFFVRSGTQHIAESAISFRSWTRPYGVAMTLLFAGLYVVRIRKLPLLNQTAAFLLIAIVLPYVSYEYTLVYVSLVYAALLLYTLQQPDEGTPLLTGRVGVATGVLFGIVFSPITNLALRHFGGQVKCVCLLLLLAGVLRYPIPSRLFGDAPPGAGLHPNEQVLAA